MMKRFWCLYLIWLPLVGLGQNWQLVWSDEFDGVELDLNNWTHDIGTGSQFGLNGWGNNELQYYTDLTNNVSVGDGYLTITAREESFGGMNYTSGRIKTKNKQFWTYGKIEARIDLPTGQGIWPAFWMLNEQGFWPGEIDIMEMVGNNPNTIYGTCHYGVPGAPVYSGGSISSPNSYADGFHTYMIEWYPDNILWYVDNQLYFQINRQELAPEYAWLFDIDHYVLLNVAVGGNWPGAPDGSTSFPQEMLVDYVRVYQYDENQEMHDVTFTVDMTETSIQPGDQVHVNGSFNGWCGTCNPLTDLGNGLWQTTLSLPPGIHEYKFTTNGWTGLQETFSQGMPCTITTYAVPEDFINRFVNVGFSNETLPIVCFNSCTGCTGNNYTGCTDPDAVNYDPAAFNDDGSCLYAVQFTVDMTQENLTPTDIVYVNGTFNNWCGACNPMEDTDQNGIWELVLTLPDGLHEYKFTTNGWGGLIENFVPGEPCTLTTIDGQNTYVNRYFDINNTSLVLPPVCFNSCSACPSTDVQITFQVDVFNENLQGMNIFLMADIFGWEASPIPLTYLGFGIWETTLTLSSSTTINYVYSIGDALIGSESVSGACAMNGVRQLVIPTIDAVLNLDCFGECGLCEGCTDPFDLNFNPFSVNNDTFCSTQMVQGCTYADAINYSALANTDDGSCVFDLASSCPEDINNDGLISTADLLLILSAFGGSCN